VSREQVSRLERDGPHGQPFDALRAVAEALGLRLEVTLRGRGGDLDRVVNAAHAALHELIARHLGTLDGWIWLPEVSYSIFGERGVIDILAWHAATRSLLIIEPTTDIVDPQGLVAVMSTRVRLARRIARDHGWTPATVSAWVVVTESKSGRRRLARHGHLLRGAFPADGRAMRAWLREPSGRISALSFWSHAALVTTREDVGQVRRVRAPG
jgi:hypothetical protein